jgi:hypothetical protein
MYAAVRDLRYHSGFIVGECILLRMYQISKYRQPSTPTILYTSTHATHYRTTGYPYYKYYVDNTRHQTTIYILQVYIL